MARNYSLQSYKIKLESIIMKNIKSHDKTGRFGLKVEVLGNYIKAGVFTPFWESDKMCIRCQLLSISLHGSVTTSSVFQEGSKPLGNL